MSQRQKTRCRLKHIKSPRSWLMPTWTDLWSCEILVVLRSRCSMSVFGCCAIWETVLTNVLMRSMEHTIWSRYLKVFISSSHSWTMYQSYANRWSRRFFFSLYSSTNAIKSLRVNAPEIPWSSQGMALRHGTGLSASILEAELQLVSMGRMIFASSSEGLQATRLHIFASGSAHLYRLLRYFQPHDSFSIWSPVVASCRSEDTSWHPKLLLENSKVCRTELLQSRMLTTIRSTDSISKLQVEPPITCTEGRWDWTGDWGTQVWNVSCIENVTDNDSDSSQIPWHLSLVLVNAFDWSMVFSLRGLFKKFYRHSKPIQMVYDKF